MVYMLHNIHINMQSQSKNTKYKIQNTKHKTNIIILKEEGSDFFFFLLLCCMHIVVGKEKGKKMLSL